MDIQPAQNAEELTNGQVVKIGSSAGIIEESTGRRRFCLIMKGTLYDYEKRMLRDSCCPYTLPMHFTTIEGIEKAYYDFTGFLQLEEYIERNRSNGYQKGSNHKPVCAALELLAAILDSLKGMENYLLFPERFLIRPDSIFVSFDGHVSIACCEKESTESTLQENIIALADNLMRLYRDHDAEQYLTRYKEKILLKNPGLDGMISMLGSLKREAGYIYWNANSFRKEDNSSRPGFDSAVEDQNQKGRNSRLGFSLKKDAGTGKFIAVQAAFAAGLAAAFLSGCFELTTFAGIAVLTAGADLWLMKKMQMRG